MKNKIILSIAILLSMSYGVLIGKYKIFPYGLLKTFQDGYEKKTEQEIKYSQIVIKGLITVSPNNLDSLKTRLNTILFGTRILPMKLPDSIFDIEDQLYSDLASIDGIEQFNISQSYGINSVGYIFHPKKSINRLLIYHQGHRGDFILGKNTIDRFLEKGFTVYAFCMPVLGKNSPPNIYLDKIGEFSLDYHEKFKFLDNPLQYFITPVISMINYSKDKNFDDISMVGISGGGWTTTLVAAVDSRIKFSFPVAGTYPMFIRLQKTEKNYGDFEQNYEKLYSQINYLDLYIMGASGKGRTQVQILNRYDPCCFDGDDYKSYSNVISAKTQDFGEGHFEVFSDSSHLEHKISDVALSKMFELMSVQPKK